MSDGNFRIRKLSDKQLVEKLREIAKKHGFDRVDLEIPLVKFTSNTNRDQNWFADDTIVKVLAMDAMFIRTITIFVGRSLSIIVTRDGNLFSDAAGINAPNLEQAGGAQNILSLYTTSKEILEEVTPSTLNLEALGAEVKAHYEAREQYLAKQEREVSAFFTQMADFSRQQTDEHQHKLDKLEADSTTRQQHLDAQHELRMSALSERDAQFDEIKSQFDLQEARGMRRKLRSDQKGELKELIKNFTLTPDTTAKRSPIWFAAVLTIVALATISLYMLFGQSVYDPQGGLNYLLVVRQLTFTLATVGFIWFFIHWSNRWFQRHADEELRLKRLSLDLDRASWIFEVMLDWQKETKIEFPPELLKQFAKNLYSADGVGDDDMTRADLLASLFGAASNLKLKSAGTELEFDRKALQKIEKG